MRAASPSASTACRPGAVRDAKKLLRGPQTEAILKTIRTEGELFAARLRSPEAMEAFQAFFQKRKPDFSKFAVTPRAAAPCRLP